MLKTPDFWTKRNFFSFALLPLSFIYFLGFFLINVFSRPRKISKPIICIGNIIAGGAGKTPTAIAVGNIMRDMEIDFAFLSRGYMNDGSKFLMLKDSDDKRAEEVGDEPLLLLNTAPTFTSKNRLFGARQIECMKKFQAILLDDGMQCNSLKRDLTILVIDGKIGFGNNFLIPAGPMREPIEWGLKKADLVVLIGEGDEDLNKKLSGKKIVKAEILPKNIEKFRNQKLIAFCGLAYPKKFFSLLEEQGLEVIETQSFPDHYHYQTSDLDNLCKAAKDKGATLITTRKDWVKFPKPLQDNIAYLDIELLFKDDSLLRSKLRKILK